MPFYKCFGCMKTFMSEGRATSCKYCNKLLSEDLNRQPNPPRLERRHSAPVLGALSQQQQVVAFEMSKKPNVRKPACPLTFCRSDQVTRQGPDPIYGSEATHYSCDDCGANFLWNPAILFEQDFAYQDVTYRQTPLNMLAFRGLNLPSPLSCLDIFKKGFPVRKDEAGDNEPWTIQFRTDSFAAATLDESAFPKVGDIFPESAHCFAGRFPGATIFPNDTHITRTYIFVCYLREGFNTYAHQRKEVALIRKYYPFLSGETMDKVSWPLQAREVAVEELDAECILASIRCDKVWNTGDWHDGGTYTLYLPSLMFNPSLAPEAKGPITRLFKHYRTGVIPSTPQ